MVAYLAPKDSSPHEYELTTVLYTEPLQSVLTFVSCVTVHFNIGFSA